VISFGLNFAKTTERFLLSLDILFGWALGPSYLYLLTTAMQKYNIFFQTTINHFPSTRQAYTSRKELLLLMVEMSSEKLITGSVGGGGGGVVEKIKKKKKKKNL
jgi:hypothetical protein